VVDLHFYRGLTHAEAGAELGVDARTVRRRWTRAQRLLADRFPCGPAGGRA
jgi:DNA-directed RNA polymerase specialized sigma24 family protein